MSAYIKTEDKSILLDHHDVGDVVITSTNESPSTKYGGEWELYDKSFAPYWTTGDALGAWTSNSNTTSMSFAYSMNNHSLWMRFNLTPAVDITDTATEFGEIDYTKLGINGQGYAYYDCWHSDNGNAIIMISLAAGGTLSTVDAISPSGHTSAAGNVVRGVVSWNVQMERMIDEFCDTFFWKRTK